MRTSTKWYFSKLYLPIRWHSTEIAIKYTTKLISYDLFIDFDNYNNNKSVLTIKFFVLVQTSFQFVNIDKGILRFKLNYRLHTC